MHAALLALLPWGPGFFSLSCTRLCCKLVPPPACRRYWDNGNVERALDAHPTLQVATASALPAAK